MEDSHMVGNGSNDFVLMEVDETWSTVEIQNQEALDLDKVSALAESPSEISFLSPDT